MDADVTTASLVTAEILVVIPRSAESMRKDYHRKRALAFFGKIDLGWNLTVPRGIMPVKLEDSDLH
jgi:hypothetical protein